MTELKSRQNKLVADTRQLQAETEEKDTTVLYYIYEIQINHYSYRKHPWHIKE